MPDNWHLIGLAGIVAALFGAGFLYLSGVAERRRLEDEAQGPRLARVPAAGEVDLPSLPAIAGARRW